jgi:hypothetical protein
VSKKAAKAAPSRSSAFELQAALRELVEEGLSPLLEALGYALQGRVLRRNCKPQQAIFLIELVSDPGEAGSFTLELGVHYPKLAASLLEMPYFSYLRPRLSPPQLSACAQRQGLGELAKGSAYPWYLGPNSDLRELTEEITVAVLEHGLSWLQARLDWRFLLEEPGSLWSLVAWKLAGRGEEFKSRLGAFLETEQDGAKRAQLMAWGST